MMTNTEAEALMEAMEMDMIKEKMNPKLKHIICKSTLWNFSRVNTFKERKIFQLYNYTEKYV